MSEETEVVYDADWVKSATPEQIHQALSDGSLHGTLKVNPQAEDRSGPLRKVVPPRDRR